MQCQHGATCSKHLLAKTQAPPYWNSDLDLLQISCGQLAVDNTAVLDRITAAAPNTMSWSNVPDYLPPSTFHRLAFACSKNSSPTHYLHTMNWSLDIKGGSIADLAAEDGMSASKRRALAKERISLVKTGMQLIAKEVAAQRAAKIMRKKPVQNIKNFADYALHMSTYQQWVKAWAKEAGVRGRGQAVVEVLQGPEYSPPSKNTCVLHLKVQYQRG
jgi:hypothetical protein